jgi:hypothetical protein
LTDSRQLAPNNQFPTDYRLPATDYRLFSLAFPAAVRHNTRQIHTFDEAATNWFGSFVGRTDAVSLLSGEVEMTGMARQVRELGEK